MADVKPIKITADVDQAAAEFQRLKGIVGEMTAEEERFYKALAESKVKMDAKKTAAEGLGVSQANVTEALRKTTEQAHGQAEGFELNKKGLRDFNEILETATGMQIRHAGAIGETFAKLGPLAVAAIAAGAAVEAWQKAEEQLDEALKHANEAVESHAKAIEKLHLRATELTDAQREVMARHREIAAEKMASEWEEQAKAVDHLDLKMKAVNAVTGEYGPILAAIGGPIVIAIGLWARLTGKMEDYEREMQRLKQAEKEALGGEEARKGLEARARLQDEADKAYLASLPKRERAMVEHMRRMEKIEADASAAGPEGAALAEKARAAEFARWQEEERGFSAHGARKVAAHRKTKAELLKDAQDMWQKIGDFAAKTNERLIAGERLTANRITGLDNAMGQAIVRHAADTARKRGQIEHSLTQVVKSEAAARVAATQEEISQTQAAAMQGFGQSKGMAVADAFINLYKGITRIWGTWGDNPYVAAALTAVHSAMVGAQIQQIRSAKPEGQAHSGMAEVSRSGSYNLIAGEMVLDPTAATSMRELSSAMKAAKPSPTSGQIAIHFNGTVVGGRKAAREMAHMLSNELRSSGARL